MLCSEEIIQFFEHTGLSGAAGVGGMLLETDPMLAEELMNAAVRRQRRPGMAAIIHQYI